MRTEQIRQAWSNELHRIEQMGTPTVIKSTRRFWKDKWHPYGWEVGFDVSVRFGDGQIGRRSFCDIGTAKGAAIGNAMRGLDMAANSHPSVKLLWDELQAREAVVEPYVAKVSQWRRGWYRAETSNSTDKLAQKFHAMRRAAPVESLRPSRRLCTTLASKVTRGVETYSDAVAKIVAAGGVAQ